MLINHNKYFLENMIVAMALRDSWKQNNQLTKDKTAFIIIIKDD